MGNAKAFDQASILCAKAMASNSCVAPVSSNVVHLATAREPPNVIATQGSCPPSASSILTESNLTAGGDGCMTSDALILSGCIGCDWHVSSVWHKLTSGGGGGYVN